MGDLKGNFVAKLDLGGRAYEIDWTLNWGTHAHESVAHWLDECWNDALTRYRVRVAEAEQAQQEANERAELARLKTKYEKP